MYSRNYERKVCQPEGSFRLKQHPAPTKSNPTDHGTSATKSQHHHHQHPQMELSSEQDVYFAEAAEIPGVPIVYRNQKSKASSPERLNLDRRNLRVIPLLEGEQMLRLLNLQNNVIARIDNLLELPNLIFLDLYNNRVETLENFHVVPNLRVLMLGKNKIKRIENLECLQKLDVLDLHSNEIEVMENLNDLVELRVLNLGGNRIEVVDNIDRLVLLTELNLRRNSIVQVNPIGTLPSLQRLFLSNNKLESLGCIEPLFQIASISELRLDSNKLCDADPSKYRWQMIQRFPALKHLDLKPLSETERKDVVRLMAQSRQKEQEKQEMEAHERVSMIESTRSNWEKREKRAASASAKSRGELSCKTDKTPRKTNDATATNTQESAKDLPPISREDANVYRNKTGFSEIEMHRSDGTVLCIYGDGLDALTNAKAQTSVSAIEFRYIHIDRIALVATSNTGNLKLFCKLKRLVFRFNDITTLDQLAWISTMGPKAEEVVISDNPIASLTLLPSFMGAKLCNVIRFNDQPILPEHRMLGEKVFPPQTETHPSLRGQASGLHVAQRQRSADSLTNDTARVRDARSAGRHSSSLAVPASFLLSEIVSCAKDAEQKSNVVDECWDDLLLAFVKDTLGDFEKNESYLSGCLDGL